MRLSPFDDYPFHQAPTPFATAFTSDAHYNDGYFCAFYAPGWYFFTGLRLHPNVNVVDGWAAVAHGGRQAVVRASRALHPRYGELDAGPVRYEHLEHDSYEVTPGAARTTRAPTRTDRVSNADDGPGWRGGHGALRAHDIRPLPALRLRLNRQRCGP